MQSDYARSKGWPDKNYGLNCKAYKELEDFWWLYTVPLSFTLAEGQIAAMVFTAIDYAYEIRVDVIPLSAPAPCVTVPLWRR